MNRPDGAVVLADIAEAHTRLDAVEPGTTVILSEVEWHLGANAEADSFKSTTRVAERETVRAKRSASGTLSFWLSTSSHRRGPIPDRFDATGRPLRFSQWRDTAWTEHLTVRKNAGWARRSLPPAGSARWPVRRWHGRPAFFVDVATHGQWLAPDTLERIVVVADALGLTLPRLRTLAPLWDEFVPVGPPASPNAHVVAPFLGATSAGQVTANAFGATRVRRDLTRAVAVSTREAIVAASHLRGLVPVDALVRAVEATESFTATMTDPVWRTCYRHVDPRSLRNLLRPVQVTALANNQHVAEDTVRGLLNAPFDSDMPALRVRTWRELHDVVARLNRMRGLAMFDAEGLREPPRPGVMRPRAWSSTEITLPGWAESLDGTTFMTPGGDRLVTQIARTEQTLLRWGAMQRHCIADYASDLSRGTSVLGAVGVERMIPRPGANETRFVPWACFEISTRGHGPSGAVGHLKQFLGAHNNDAADEVVLPVIEAMSAHGIDVRRRWIGGHIALDRLPVITPWEEPDSEPDQEAA